MIRVDHVLKTFRGPAGDVRALNNISLEVPAGDFVAVQGPSGCGKTTLLLVAGCMLRPTSGTVTVCGRDPYALSPGERSAFRARSVGFVFQDFHLIPYLTVRENILAASIPVKNPDAESRTAELITQFSLTDRADHLPGQLSTGEQQRTALARALLNKPSVLLADEPTGNLDSANGAVVLDSLASFAKQGGSVLLVTHDDKAAARADRIVRMKKGDD